MTPSKREAVPDVEFCIIGANSKFRRLKQMPGVQWKQGIPDVQYLQILQNTDLLVLPLIASTSVTTINEVLACGVPVITNRGGVSDYLNEDCSVQVETQAPEEMNKSVIELLRSECERKRMGVNARKRGLELHWLNSAAKMREVYDRLA